MRAVTRADGSFEMVAVPAGEYGFAAYDSGYRWAAREPYRMQIPEAGCEVLPPGYLERYGLRERANEALDKALDVAARVADRFANWFN